MTLEARTELLAIHANLHTLIALSNESIKLHDRIDAYLGRYAEALSPSNDDELASLLGPEMAGHVETETSVDDVPYIDQMLDIDASLTLLQSAVIRMAARVEYDMRKDDGGRSRSIINRIRDSMRNRAAAVAKLDAAAARLDFVLVPVHHQYVGCADSQAQADTLIIAAKDKARSLDRQATAITVSGMLAQEAARMKLVSDNLEFFTGGPVRVCTTTTTGTTTTKSCTARPRSMPSPPRQRGYRRTCSLNDETWKVKDYNESIIKALAHHQRLYWQGVRMNKYYTWRRNRRSCGDIAGAPPSRRSTRKTLEIA